MDMRWMSLANNRLLQRAKNLENHLICWLLKFQILISSSISSYWGCCFFLRKMQRQRQKMATQKKLTRRTVRDMQTSTICTTLAWAIGPFSASRSQQVSSWPKFQRASSSSSSDYISSKISSFIYFQSSFQDLITSSLSSSLCFSVYIPMITIDSERLFTAPVYLVAETMISILSSSFLSVIGTQIAKASFSLPFSCAASVSLCYTSLITNLLSRQSFKSAYPPGQFESLLQQERQSISLSFIQILTSRKVPQSLQTKQKDLVGIFVNAENSSFVYCLCGTFVTLKLLYSQITLVKKQTCNSSFLFLVLDEKQQGMASRMISEQLFPCFSH